MKKCLIVSVKEHKTGAMGPAKVTIDNQLMHRINAYQTHIRPHMSPSGEDIPQLFILPGGRPIKRFASIVDYMSKQLKVAIPTPTAVRKVGATAAALACGGVDRNLVAKQMSHSPGVHACYYEAVKAPANTLQAYSVMEGLRKGKCRKLHSYNVPKFRPAL